MSEPKWNPTNAPEINVSLRNEVKRLRKELKSSRQRERTSEEADLIHECLFHHEMRMTLPARIYNAVTKLAASRHTKEEGSRE